ncbi:unnamed protein product [Linum trigynum]|uniref:Uncharacterized protein n=1 Tax=Linum trigynum TaxID=586398 RepID=A0AAV2FCP2_9ROSI
MFALNGQPKDVVHDWSIGVSRIKDSSGNWMAMDHKSSRGVGGIHSGCGREDGLRTRESRPDYERGSHGRTMEQFC